MKQIYYIANMRMPTEKAHGIQIMEMCHAFSGNGFEVELVVPDRKTVVDGVELKTDPFGYYKVDRNFRIRRLWCLDLVRFGKIGFRIQSLTFALSVLAYALSRGGKFYSREELLAAMLRLIGKDTAWEAHMGQQNIFVDLIIRFKVPIVVITKALKDLYIRMGMPTQLIHVAPDGVDLDKFIIDKTREEARNALGFPSDSKIVLYTGHLYSWKGADTLALAADKVSAEAKVLFVGGTDKHINVFKERYGHIHKVSILGNKPHSEMPLYLRAADVLVIPNSSKEDISKLYTSPMKLFEYMASGTPIVASDLPSLREILDEGTCYFSTPDDPQSLAKAIDKALADPKEAEAKAALARERGRNYSWTNRAKEILSFWS